MFVKKKSIVHIRREDVSSSSKTYSKKLNDGELLDYLKDSVERFGDLVITDVVGNEIFATTTNTMKHYEVEDELNDIKELIRGFINE